MHLTQGAIVTRRTARYIIADCFNGSHRMPLNHGMSNAHEHATAAAMLVRKLALAWIGKRAPEREPINAPQCGQWIAGDAPTGSGYVFVHAGETNRTSGLEPSGFVQNCETMFGK